MLPLLELLITHLIFTFIQEIEVPSLDVQ
jgi:hypothetical protein